MKTLILYHYFEKDQTYIDNLNHFLVFGVNTEDDFIFIVSGESRAIDFPKLPNVKVLRVENKNNDYGGYCAGLDTIDVGQYSDFIFVNSSVRGPFLNYFTRGRWSALFKAALSDHVLLVGTTINILPPQSPYSVEYHRRYGGAPPFSHIQTMAFALSQKTLTQLLDLGLFKDRERMSKDDVIIEYELRLSQLIVSLGGQIRCFLPEYNHVNYAGYHSDINPASVNGDPCFNGAYFGRTIHPYEAMFVKTNRDLLPTEYLERLAFSMLHTGSIDVSPEITASVDRYLARLAHSG